VRNIVRQIAGYAAATVYERLGGLIAIFRVLLGLSFVRIPNHLGKHIRRFGIGLAFPSRRVGSQLLIDREQRAPEVGLHFSGAVLTRPRPVQSWRGDC
jgi:hypothetical protein